MREIDVLLLYSVGLLVGAPLSEHIALMAYTPMLFLRCILILLNYPIGKRNSMLEELTEGYFYVHANVNANTEEDNHTSRYRSAQTGIAINIVIADNLSK